MDNNPLRNYSVLEPLGQSSSSCGYCDSSSETSISYGLWAHLLTPQTYQVLMDRGWRRSGSYLYLPDRSQTCCPPYTIKCRASSFRPTRSQRQTVNRWKNFLLEPLHKSPAFTSTDHLSSKLQTPFNLSQIFNSIEDAHKSNKNHRKFEIKLEPAHFSKQKYELYRKYQLQVHNEPEEKVTEESFTRFLCTNPFKSDKTVAQHACWILDGEKLLAFSVVDILPLGISSVYFVWDPELARFGLGKLSALREIGWIQDWKSVKFDHLFDWYYLGFYIHSCPKMKYKGDYSPSFLLDPSTLKWEPLEKCISILETKPEAQNVTKFNTDQDQSSKQEQSSTGGFIVNVLTPLGKIDNIASTDLRIKETVDKLGFEVLQDSVICI